MENADVTFLLVDDDEIDVEGVKRAFQKAKIANPIVTATNGVEALEILRGENGKEKLKRPFIILLDLNMPKMNGHEFLEELRSDLELADTTVFVLTTSDHDRDMWNAYRQHVAGYVLKSRVGRDFSYLIGMLDNVWRIVTVPVEHYQGEPK